MKTAARTLPGLSQCRNGPRKARHALTVAWAAAFTATGCAVHYQNSRTGAEHLWGLGQMRLQVEPAKGSDQLVAVTTGWRVPGLCLEIGRDHFGIAFGYLDRQQLAVVNSSATNEVRFPQAAPRCLSFGSSTGLWAIGHAQLRTVARSNHHYAVITGKALGGLGVGVGGNDSGMGLAWDTRQRAVVFDDTICMEFDQDATRWPGIDLFTTQVTATHVIPAKGDP